MSAVMPLNSIFKVYLMKIVDFKAYHLSSVCGFHPWDENR